MNHKPWLWRKRSMEKTILEIDQVTSPSKVIEQEVHKLSTEKESGLERSKSLNEKLATVLLDSSVADYPLAKQAQRSQQEDREVDTAKDLDKEVPAESESVTPPDATLHEPSQPLSRVQEEQEERLCGANPKTSKEHEKIQKELEEKLKETSKRIEDLTAENTHLTNALLSKEKCIEDMLRCKEEADAEFRTLMARLDSTEKENAFLRYEFHMLEKELEIRKEEMDYSRQYAEESHKQHLESSQKASNLEAECEKLRLRLQKRPSGPGSVNMKNEVGIMRRETDMRKRKSNPNRHLINKNNYIGNSTEISEKGSRVMIKHWQDLDDENKALKRILSNKNSELDSSRFMYAETASRLSQAEILLRKFSETQKSMELARCYYPTSGELPLITKFDISSNDEDISSGSRANARISELEHLRTAEAKNHMKSKSIEISDLHLMDDFVEMEKRAIVSVDMPRREYISDITGRELVPVEQDLGLSGRKQEIQFKHPTTEKSFDWLQIVLNAILEEKRVTKRTLDELFEDIKIALGCINHSTACKSDIIQKSVHRIIKLIEGIAPKSFICNNGPDCLKENQNSDISKSPTSKEYFFHVFQWKVSDLNSLLHQLVHTCKDLLTGRADFENVIEEVAFALDWSINNSANSTNASIARDKIKKHFIFHQSQNESEKESQIDVDDKHPFHSPSVAYPDDQGGFFNTKNNQYDLLKEVRKLKDDLGITESTKKDLEVKLRSVTDESQNLTKQCQDAQNIIKGLESEIEILKGSKAIIEDQVEKQKMINEDLDTQLTISQAKLNGIFQKFSSLEVELEVKKNSCEELEATCLELQLQLESIAKKESPTSGKCEMEKIYQTGWEITTASSKLSECQETILNLGKQLKALASSSEVAVFDRGVSATSPMANPTQKKNLTKRCSLLNQMLAEDDAKAGINKSVQIEESKGAQRPPLLQPEKSALQTPHIMVNEPENSLGSEQNDRSNSRRSLAVVPSKKRGGFDLLRKLLFRRKKGKNKGTKFLALA